MTIKDFVKQSKYNSVIRNCIHAWNLSGYDIQAWIGDNKPIVTVPKTKVITDIRTETHDWNHVYLVLDEYNHFILLEWKPDEDNESEFVEYHPLMQNCIGRFARTPNDCIAWLNELSVQSLLRVEIPFTKKQKKQYRPYRIEYKYDELKKRRLENVTILKFDKILRTHLAKYVHSYLHLEKPNFQKEFLFDIRLYIEDLFKTFVPHIDLSMAEIKFTEFDIEDDALYIELRGDFSKCTGKLSDKYVSVIPPTIKSVSRVAGRLVGTGWNIVQFYMAFYQILGHFIQHTKYYALSNYYSNLKCVMVTTSPSNATYHIDTNLKTLPKVYHIKFNE